MMNALKTRSEGGSSSISPFQRKNVLKPLAETSRSPGQGESESKLFQRRKVAEELLSTERTYANELARFVETMCPRMEVCDTEQKQRFMEELTDLIHNLEQFLHLSRRTIEELEVCDTARIGPVVKRLTSVLPLYVQYAKNYALAGKVIHDLTKDEEFLKDWRGEPRERTSLRVTPTPVQIQKSNSARLTQHTPPEPELRRAFSDGSEGLPSPTSAGKTLLASKAVTPPRAEVDRRRVTSLQGFLILPVQRVPRYVLLFQEILKRLESELLTEDERQEKQDIALALEAAKNCASAMNEAIENVKRLADLRDLQNRFMGDASTLAPVFSHPEARIVKADVLGRVARNGTRKDYFFHLIAPDTLLYSFDESSSPTSQQGGSDDDSNSTPLKLRRMIKLTPQTSAVSSKDDLEDAPACFVLETADRTMTLIAPTIAKRFAWVQEIAALIKTINAKAPPPIPRKSFFGRRSSANSMSGMERSSPVLSSLQRTFGGASEIPSSPVAGTTMSTPPIGKFHAGTSPLHLGSTDVYGADDAAIASMCHICSSTFSLLHRKHTCGRCGRDVCSSCSSQRRCLQRGVGPAVRTCDACGEDMDMVAANVEPRLVRFVLEISGAFRKDDKISSSSDKLPRENFWALSFLDQERGPSGIGTFSCTIPQVQGPLPRATLYLLGKNGAVVVATAELDLMEVIRHPRCAKGYTERLDLMDPTTIDNTSSASSPIVRTASSDGFRLDLDGGSGAEKRRSHSRRRSLVLPPSLSQSDSAIKAPAASPMHSPASGLETKHKFNLQLLKEYEALALENVSSILLARLVDILVTWAIENEQEGTDVQASLANMLYRFHRRRSMSIAGDQTTLVNSEIAAKEEGNPMLDQIVESEKDYVNKLQVLVDRYQASGGTTAAKLSRSASDTGGSSSSGRDTSPTILTPGSRASVTVGKGSVLRLAATFGAIAGGGDQSSSVQSAASLGSVLASPSVSSCMSVCEQMLTIHKSFLVDLKTLGATDSLQRLASLMKVYASYGASLPEAYIALGAHQQATKNSPTHLNKKNISSNNGTEDQDGSNDALSNTWFHLGAAQSDPEDALRWVVMACGMLRPFHKPPADISLWSVLDLLICPLARMNEYCQLARELDPVTFTALNETRRLLTKAIMRKSNTRLLREIDMGMVDLADSLVDVRRWMIRTCPLVMVDDSIDEQHVPTRQRVVQAFLFSDQLILAKLLAHDRWMVLKRFTFHDRSKRIFVRDASVPVHKQDEAFVASMLLNPHTPAGDSRFAFEVGIVHEESKTEMDKVVLMIPNLGALMSGAAGIVSPSAVGLNAIGKQVVTFWTKLGLVAFDKDMLCAVGPGGFSNTDQSHISHPSLAAMQSPALSTRSLLSGTDSNVALKGLGTDRSRDVRRKQQLRLEWFSDISRLGRIWYEDAKVDACWYDDVRALRLLLSTGSNGNLNSAPAASPQPNAEGGASVGSASYAQPSNAINEVPSSSPKATVLQPVAKPPMPANAARTQSASGSSAQPPKSPSAERARSNQPPSLIVPTSPTIKTSPTATAEASSAAKFEKSPPVAGGAPKPSGSVTASLLKQAAATSGKRQSARSANPNSAQGTSSPPIVMVSPSLPVVKRSTSAPAASTQTE